MPRNSAGTYTLPAGNPVVAGTTIDASWANDTMSDMANEITNSLSRTGAGGMLAPFRVADGSVSAPGLGFTNETNSGLYRAGTGELWFTIGGVAVAQITGSGLLIPSGKRISLPAPVNDADGANKEYVDDLVAPVVQYADLYLGSKSSDPTTNNSGGALVEGVTYWSSTLEQMRVYNGTNWVPMPTISSVVGQTFSGDGVDTTFTLANPTGDAINLEVFISGVRQVPTSDYSVSGTTLTFVTAPPSGTDNIFVRYAQLGTITEGAGSIVYTPAGTGAVATTVQSKLRETVSVLDFGAVADGTTNDSAAFAAARTAAAALGRKVYAPAGHYKLNTALTSSEDLILEGDGPGTILDFTGTVTGGSYALDANGTATQIEELSGTQNVGSMTVTFVSAPSLSVGDVFVIYNPTASSWSGFRTDYRAGEWCEVESISGSTVTLRNPLYDTYAAANVDVYKITGPEVVLRNFSVRGTTVLGLIKASLCIAPLAENITADHTNDSVIYWDRCFKPTVNNSNIRNIGDGGDDYGIVIGNSQHARTFGGYVYSRRHAVTHGGGSGVCSVPTRDSRVIGSVLKNDINSGTEAADFHGNTEDSSFIDCTIYNGANLGGKDNGYVNCKITNALAGYCVYHAEIKGGRLGTQGCTFSTFVDPNLSIGRAIYDIGTGNNAITSNTTEDVTFFVENCNVRGRNLSSSTYFARMRLAGATVKTNIEIDGVTADVNALAGVLLTSVTSGTASSDFIIVDRISNFPSGTILHNSTGSAYTNFPHRCQKQTGKVSLTATSGTAFTLASAITFKYQYPREPVGHATTGSSTALLYNGNRAVWASLYQIRSNDVRPFIESGDATNWTATATVTVNWAACIDEV